ncbi:MAG: hypothetical protein A2505_09685 [Deltaproteobacteria bacterium RIFOXYD12_FULL_55_16]|nr:MAG: hypothetical protein A2505_09685 [Deltaproteobacteria bacterium RIFOXYD12_FULL_55_16]
MKKGLLAMGFMRVKIPVLIVFCLLSCVAFCQSAAAETTSACHCFQERTFNPADKFAADEYLLATTFNSLLSRAFNLPKREIVMLKMQGGAGQNDLLLALQAAKVSGTELKHFLGFREKKFSWQKILSELLPAKNFKNDPVLKGLLAGSPDTEAAQKNADRLLVEFFHVPPKVVFDLRASGLNEKELALLLILEHAKKLPPHEGARQHAQEGKSWSEIAHQLGLEPAEAGKLMIDYPGSKRWIEGDAGAKQPARRLCKSVMTILPAQFKGRCQKKSKREANAVCYYSNLTRAATIAAWAISRPATHLIMSSLFFAREAARYCLVTRSAVSCAS